MNLATRCSACGTAFRVVPDQLKVSQGWVRCGHCHEVFNGQAALFELPPSSKKSASAEAPKAAAPQPASRVAIPAPASSARTSNAGGQSSAVRSASASTASSAVRPGQPSASATVASASSQRSALAPVSSSVSAPASSPASLPAQSAEAPSTDLTADKPGRAPTPGSPTAAAMSTATPSWQPAPPPSQRTYFAPSSARAAIGKAASSVPERLWAARSAPSSAPAPIPAPPPLPDFSAETVDRPDFTDWDDPPSLTAVPTAWSDLDPLARRSFPAPVPQSFSEPEFGLEPAAIQAPRPAASSSAPVSGGVPAPRSSEATATPTSSSSPQSEPALPKDDDWWSDAHWPSQALAGSPATITQSVEASSPHAAWAADAVDRFESSSASGAASSQHSSGFATTGAGTASARLGRKPRKKGKSKTAAPQFAKRVDRAARWQRPAVRAALSTAAVLLGLLLAAQYVWRWRETLAMRHPGLQSGLRQISQAFGQEWQAPREVDRIVVDSSQLGRTASPGVLRLLVDLHNTAPYPVRAPALELSIQDADGSTLARKVLLPQELGFQQAELPAEAAKTLDTRLQVGNLRVSGYRLEVFYP